MSGLGISGNASRDRRARFAIRATLGYLSFAFVWIFFSDRLLSQFVDPASITWLSTVKGFAFVAVTGALLYFLLDAVPDRKAGGEVRGLLESIVFPSAVSRWPPWATHGFAVALTLLMLILRMRLGIPFVNRPLLIIFMLPILLSGLIGGLGPGLTAIAVTIVGVHTWLLASSGAGIGSSGPDEWIQWCFLILGGLLVGLLGGSLREALARAESQSWLLNAVVSGCSEAIYVKDRSGRYLLCNDGMARIFGRKPQEIVGQSDRFLLSPESLAVLAVQEQEIMDSARTVRHEQSIVTLAGRSHTLLVNKGPVFDSGGGVVGVFGIAQDISDLKAAETRMRQLNAELEDRVEERTADLLAANQELQMFASAVSHDLKAPLRAIGGFAGILENECGGDLKGDCSACLGQIQQGVDRMRTLIDDLLAYTRINQGEMGLRALDVNGIVDSVLAERSGDIVAQQVKFRRDVAPARVVANRDGLQQALRNLVDNALKYASPERPLVVEIIGELYGRRYRLCVRDNGIGFDMAFRQDIFEAFKRLHSSQKYPGSGIGLALVKRAMERMGGRVWAESRQGEGSSFFLELEAVNT